ncbi:MAG: D-2-hydroxyacid dehydrogenase [Paracoccaceae bacterium]|nr:D-2-hydroxyacid dehydrogenase [Paracoccaceae bacterium]
MTASKQHPRVIIHNDETAPLAEMLRAKVPESEIAECLNNADLPDLISEFKPDVVYSVRFSSTPAYPRDALFAPGGPAWVSTGGVGIDHLGRWDPEVTTVTNAAGVAADMMAEYVIGGFLHFTLDVDGLQADKASRVWRARTVRPLAGRTLLIVGLGHTGRAVAKLAKAFGMTVTGTRARPAPMENVDDVRRADDLDALLPHADFIAICTPLIDETRGLISAGRIARMKPGVILADVSRGGVVDQTALVAALDSGHVAGAALDVFETEPLPGDHPLWAVPNALISPHCSAVHDGWNQASFALFLDNLVRWMAGQPLNNVVDPARGY